MFRFMNTTWSSYGEDRSTSRTCLCTDGARRYMLDDKKVIVVISLEVDNNDKVKHKQSV